MITIQDVANKAGVSVATVSRVLNDSNKVKYETAEKVKEVMKELNYQRKGSVRFQKNVTINDVANKAGVSAATVSRVLNDSEEVVENTRQKVIKAIEELDYTPNINARHLRRSETKLIGLLIPDISNSFFGTVVKGVEKIADFHGYNVILSDTKGELDREEKCIDMLKNRRVDGLIYMGVNFDQSRIKLLESCEFPVVVISREEEIDLPKVNINNFNAAYDITKYLIKSGYRKIAHISGPFNDYTAGVRRLRGYKEALVDEDINYNEELVVEGDFTLKRGYEAMNKILDFYRMPDAVFAANDQMAIGAIRAIKERGLHIPDDIAMVGFDNVSIAEYNFPSLTTIAQPIYQLGIEAMTMLTKLILNEELEKEEIFLDYDLIIRSSS